MLLILILLLILLPNRSNKIRSMIRIKSRRNS